MKLIKELALTAACLALCLILICFSPAAKSGIMDALKLCANILIPSMFPFLVLSNFIALSSVSSTVGKGIGGIISRLFRLPENASSVLLLSLTAGYPTGAVMVSSLLEHQEIDRETGARLLKFCFNSGLPFAVTAVGSFMLNDRKAGFVLFLSNLLSTLLIGLTDRRGRPKCAREYLLSYPLNAPDALTESVKKGSAAMLNVCAYVILFGALNGLAGTIEAIQPVYRFLLPLLEITSGTAACIKSVSLPLLAFYLGFGGLCIHLQLLFAVRQTGMKIGAYFKCRLLQAGLSYLICRLLLLFFPVTETVFSNLSGTTARVFSISLPLTAIMLLMSLVLILDIDKQKKIC